MWNSDSPCSNKLNSLFLYRKFRRGALEFQLNNFGMDESKNESKTIVIVPTKIFLNTFHVSYFTFTARKEEREGKEWLHSTFFPPVVQPFPSWKRVIHQFPGQEPRNLGRFLPFTPLVAGPSPQFLSIKIWLIPPDTIKFHKVLRLCPKRRTKPPPRIPRAVVYYTREENSAGANDRNSRFPSTGERTR